MFELFVAIECMYDHMNREFLQCEGNHSVDAAWSYSTTVYDK